MCYKILITLILAVISFNIKGQLITPIDSLLNAIDTTYNQINSAELYAHKEVKKYRWVNYMPSIGYDVLYRRPVVSINLSNFGRYLNDNQEKKYIQQSIIQTNQIALEKEKKTITTKYNHLVNLFSSYDLEIQIYMLYYKLFDLSSAKYENEELTIEQFTQEQIKIKEKVKNLYVLKDRLYLAIIELEQLTNYTINYEIKPFTIPS